MIDRSCVRCGLDCPHVEAGGMHYCPNCGPPIDAEAPGMVRFAFGLGCALCGLAGRGPMARDAREATTTLDPRAARIRELEALVAQQRAVVEAAREFVAAKRTLRAALDDASLDRGAQERHDDACARRDVARAALDAAVDALPQVVT